MDSQTIEDEHMDETGDYRVVGKEVLKSEEEEYELLGVIGIGAFGKVVKSLQKSTNECVAIKILKNCADLAEEIFDEVKMTKMLMTIDTREFNFVQIAECFQHKDHWCIVFELLEQELKSFYKNNPLPARNVPYIIQQLLVALLKLKELNVIHTDVKTSNIMMVNSKLFPCKVKLIDFGSSLKTKHGVSVGYVTTRQYRAPEVLLEIPFSEKIDMWSLGCVAAELLIKQLLFNGETAADHLQYIFETQGMPPKSMLAKSPIVDLYFDKIHDDWKLKEITLKEGKVHVKRFSRLESIFSCNFPQDLDIDELKEEIFFRTEIINLIKKMLQVDERHRITPEEALETEIIKNAKPPLVD